MLTALSASLWALMVMKAKPLELAALPVFDHFCRSDLSSLCEQRIEFLLRR